MSNSRLRVILFISIIVLTCASLYAQAQSTLFETPQAITIPVSKTQRNTPYSTHNFEFDYSYMMLGQSQESAFESYKMASFRLYSIMKYRISDTVLVYSEPKLIFRTGAEQVMDGNSQNSTAFMVAEASIVWTPFSWLKLNTGILDQNFHHSFMMFEDQSFPGVRSNLYFGSGNWKNYFELEKNILTFSGNSNTSNQIEKTPSFQHATIGLGFFLNQKNQIKLSLGAWQFSDLPSSLAASAMLNGNTVNRISDTHSVFAYNFSGYEARVRFSSELSFINFALYSEGIYNTQAPAGLNSAWNAGNEFTYRSGNLKIIGFDLQYFHVEPDAVVSTFNISEFDRSNRNGLVVMPYFKWGKKQNTISFRYVQSTLIYDNAPQSDLTQMRIRWETDYEIL